MILILLMQWFVSQVSTDSDHHQRTLGDTRNRSQDYGLLIFQGKQTPIKLFLLHVNYKQVASALLSNYCSATGVRSQVNRQMQISDLDQHFATSRSIVMFCLVTMGQIPFFNSIFTNHNHILTNTRVVCTLEKNLPSSLSHGIFFNSLQYNWYC